jgi:hypothetical protein
VAHAADDQVGVVAADIDDSREDVDVAVRLARPWRRTVRSGAFDQHQVEGAPAATTAAAFRHESVDQRHLERRETAVSPPVSVVN